MGVVVELHRERVRGRIVLDSARWCRCRYCRGCRYGWSDGFSERGGSHDPRMYGGGLWRTSFLRVMIVIQRHLGGGLRRPDGEERACSGGVAFSWIVRADNGRVSLFFWETLISNFRVLKKKGLLPGNFVS